MADDTSTACRRALHALETFGPVLSIKRYRVELDPVPAVPVIPCLDHEAMLHPRVGPHVAAYVQERGSGDLHEVVVLPQERRLEIDLVSTWGVASAASRSRLLARLAAALPEYRRVVRAPSRWRDDHRAIDVCRAHVALTDVLLGTDLERTGAAVARLQTVGTLMEKQSRVGSWAVRTVTAPILATAGVITYQVLGLFTAQLGPAGVSTMRYAVLALLGGAFLYYGLRAVQLTAVSNRVWKRATEYRLILQERQRLGRSSRQ
jgi:hypothetical protein